MSGSCFQTKSDDRGCLGGEISLTLCVHSGNQNGERWFRIFLPLRWVVKQRIRQKAFLEIASIMKKRDSSRLKEIGGIGAVAKVLDSDLENGKKAVEACQVFDGTNGICENGFFKYFTNDLNWYTIVFLVVSAALSFGIEMKKQGPRSGWHDGAEILFALFLLLLVPPVCNFVNERILQKRHNKHNSLEVKVKRGGHDVMIPASSLMKGDIVSLKTGDRVPADGLFMNGEDLELDEVSNSKIDRDVNPFLFYGSKVSKGQGCMLVTSDKSLSLVNADSDRTTLLLKKIEKLYSYAEMLSLSVSALTIFVVLVKFLCEGQQEDVDLLSEPKGNTKMKVLIQIFKKVLLRSTGGVRILASSLAVVVIGIQQTMYLAVAISLYCLEQKVKSDGSEVRNSSAIGTMGLVTVICIDITGGFMCDIVEVKNFFIGGEDVINEKDSETEQPVIEALRQRIFASTCDPGLSASDWAKSGRSMNSSGHDHTRLRIDNNGSFLLLDEEGDDENSEFFHLEGKASVILNLCSHYYNSKGELHAIKDHKRFEHIIGEMEKVGHRAIAFACKNADILNANEDGLCLLAIAGLKYSCSEKIKKKMKHVKDTGVCIKLVSGDELSMARAVADKLGIIEIQHCLNGQQFRDLNDSAREETIKQIALVGSCLPDDFLRVVQSLQKSDQVVAFVGGSSVTDIPVLKAADISISKKAWSTETVREISDIIITDDESLPKIMHHGKCSYLNIQKFTELQLTTCLSGLVTNLGSAICSWDSPLSVIQLFWVNSVMCYLGALIMAMDLNLERQSDRQAMATQPLVTRPVWKYILIQALHQAYVLLILHLVGLPVPSMKEAVWKSLVFNSFMLCQIFNLFKAMNIFKKEVIQTLLRHYWFWPSVALVLVLQVLFVELAGSLAASARLNSIHWAISVIIAALTSECTLSIIADFFADSLDNSHRVRTPSLLPIWGVPLTAMFISSATYYFIQVDCILLNPTASSK